MTQEQQRALNIRAINAEQTMYFCDSLETGEDKNEVKSMLEKYYSIIDRESALETLCWLRDEGHRIYFESIKEFVAGYATAIDNTYLDQEKGVRAYQYIQNLNDTIGILCENQFISSKSDLHYKSILGWDMGRLVLVTRCCYECGYVSEEEAWDYISNALIACSKIYSNWEEFAAGYVIGRSMWGGNNMSLPGIITIIKDLLSDSESPWLNIQFK